MSQSSSVQAGVGVNKSTPSIANESSASGVNKSTMSVIDKPGEAEKKIAELLQILITAGGLELTYDIVRCKVSPPLITNESADKAPDIRLEPVNLKDAASEAVALRSSPPEIAVAFTGPDTPLLLARNAELLHAIEHIAAKMLRLEPEDHDRISFDAEGFKANRDRDLLHSTKSAIEEVRATGRPHAFPPMTSRERRMVHLALSTSGLPSASSGEGPRRFVVLYPESQGPASTAPDAVSSLLSSSGGYPSPLPSHDRTQALRNTFRRR